MNRQQTRELARLEEKIAKCKASNDYIRLSQLTTERDRIIEAMKSRQQITLKDAMEKYTPEERREATMQVIYAVAVADILHSATMDVEQTLKKRFGIAGLPMMEELRDVVRRLGEVVKTIDKVGMMSFSVNYADVVEEIEMKCEKTMKNYIYNEMMKSSNKNKDKEESGL